jgi:ribosomal protein L11 methylase PrmA
LRFINEISRADLIVHNRTEAALLAELATRGYAKLANQSEHRNSGQLKEHATDTGYDYLLELPIHSLTQDRVPTCLTR